MGIHVYFTNTSQLGVVDHAFEVAEGSRNLSLLALWCFQPHDMFPVVDELDPGEVWEGPEYVFVYPSTTVRSAIQNIQDAWPLFAAIVADQQEARAYWETALQQLWAMKRPYVLLNSRDYDVLHGSLFAPWFRRAMGHNLDSIKRVNDKYPQFHELFPTQPLPSPFPDYLRRGCAMPWPHRASELKVTWECPAGALLNWTLIGLDAGGRWVPTGHAVRTGESATAALTLALNELPPALQRLCLVVWAEGAPLAALYHLWLRLYAADCVAETLYGANAWGNATAAMALEWRKQSDGWSICATGTPLEQGLWPWLAQIGVTEDFSSGLRVDSRPRYHDIPTNMFIERSLPRGQRVPWADCVPDRVAYWCVSHSAPPVVAEVRVYDAGGRLLGTVPSDSASCWPGLASVAQGIWRVDLDQLPAAATRLQCCLYSATPLNGLDFVWARWFRAPHVVCSTLYGSNALDETTVAVVAELLRDGGQWWLAAPEESALPADGVELPTLQRPGIDQNWYLDELRAALGPQQTRPSDKACTRVDIGIKSCGWDYFDVAIFQQIHYAHKSWPDPIPDERVVIRLIADDFYETMCVVEAINHVGQREACPLAITQRFYNSWELDLRRLPDSVNRVRLRWLDVQTGVSTLNHWVTMYSTGDLGRRMHYRDMCDVPEIIWEIEKQLGRWVLSQPRQESAYSPVRDSRVLAARIDTDQPAYQQDWAAKLLQDFIVDVVDKSAHPTLSYDFGSRELAIAVLADYHQLPQPKWPVNFRRTPCWDLFDAWKTTDLALFHGLLLATCDFCTAEINTDSDFHAGVPAHCCPSALWLVLDMREARGLVNPPLRHPLLVGV